MVLARKMNSKVNVKALFPTRAIALLLMIGLLDLVVTAVLHSQGRIVELNPLMRSFIERGEWLFVLVKGSTLLLAWYCLSSYARSHKIFVRKACLLGSAAYVLIWAVWFVAA